MDMVCVCVDIYVLKEAYNLLKDVVALDLERTPDLFDRDERHCMCYGIPD